MPQLTTRELLRLALPSMAFVILTNAYRSVDQFWIQDLGVEAQGAIGASFFVLIALFALFELTGIGAAPLIARATGARDELRRRKVLGTAIVATVISSLAVSLVLPALSPMIAGAIGLEGETAKQCATYLRWIAWTQLSLALTPLVDQAFVAMGNTRTPMKLQALSLAANTVMTPFFVFEEVAGLPGLGMGIAGAALASNASRALSTGLGLWLLVGETGLRAEDLRLGPELRRILRVGNPVAAGTLLYAGVYWGLLRTSVSPLGPEVNAALGIGFSALEGFSWPAFHGLSLAVSSLVGRSLGAGRPDRAWEAVRMAFPLMTGLGLMVALIFLVGAAPLTGIFTDDPAVHREATLYAVIVAFSQPFVAWETLSEGALNGSGDTRAVLRWDVPFNLLRIPLAWLMAFPLGMASAGIWWAINLTSVAKAAGKGWTLWRRAWLEHQV